MSQELTEMLGKPPAKVETPYDKAPQVEISSFPFNTLSNKGRRFTIKTPAGKEVKGKPGAALNVIILGSAPRPHRSWYAKAYDANNPAPPDCQSENGVYPAAHVVDKQSKKCEGCKWNQPGTAANGQGKACSTNIPAVVVPITKDKPAMNLAAVWRINATSAFEKETNTDEHYYSFMALNKALQNNGWVLPNLVVSLQHDEDNEDGHLVTFKPLKGITADMAQAMADAPLVPIERMISTDPDVINGVKDPNTQAAGDYQEAADNAPDADDSGDAGDDGSEAAGADDDGQSEEDKKKAAANAKRAATRAANKKKKEEEAAKAAAEAGDGGDLDDGGLDDGSDDAGDDGSEEDDGLGDLGDFELD